MASDGLGLIGMRERIEALGGTLRLRRNTPSGLEILAALPETSA
jgi:signal transduction histidine kinase